MAPQQGKIFLNRGVELNVGDSFDSDTVLEYMPTTGKYGLPLDSFTYTVYADGFNYSESEATIFCFVERANDPHPDAGAVQGLLLVGDPPFALLASLM